jgi:dTDP-4-amino-4,6-dideoxygalactose transaminase
LRDDKIEETAMKIPANNLKVQIEPLEDSLREAFDRVLESGWFLGGPEVDAFEKEFTSFTDAGFTVACSNGTDALALAFRALGLGGGDEIVMPSHTAPPCYHAALSAGCTPVFAEVDEFHCLDPESAQAMIGPRTRAVLAVHLYGQPCDMENLTKLCQEKGLFLIEDCAQAHGARHHGMPVGAFGDLAAFSFYPTKNLGALGDAGAVCGKDASLEERIRRIRQYGESERYVSVEPGLNSRMDEFQAAFLRTRLKRVGRELARREWLADLYAQILSQAPVGLPAIRPGCLHGWHLFTIRAERRDELIRHLTDKGVGTAVHYPVPGHRQPMFTENKAPHRAAKLAETERLAGQILSLPFHSEIEKDQIRTVCAAINEFYGT